MSDNNDPKTFDLIAALQGRSYPKETVTIFLDEALMYEYAKATKAADQDPQNKEKAAAVEALSESFKSLALKVTVRGIPSHVHKSIRDTVLAKHPIQYDHFNQPKANPEFSELYDQLLWENQVVQIEAPDGSTLTPTPEDIRAMRREAPETAVNAIVEAINLLSEGAQSGYEQIVQDPSFLSQP